MIRPISQEEQCKHHSKSDQQQLRQQQLFETTVSRVVASVVLDEDRRDRLWIGGDHCEAGEACVHETVVAAAVVVVVVVVAVAPATAVAVLVVSKAAVRMYLANSIAHHIRQSCDYCRSVTFIHRKPFKSNHLYKCTISVAVAPTIAAQCDDSSGSGTNDSSGGMAMAVGPTTEWQNETETESDRDRDRDRQIETNRGRIMRQRQRQRQTETNRGSIKRQTETDGHTEAEKGTAGKLVNRGCPRAPMLCPR